MSKFETLLEKLLEEMIEDFNKDYKKETKDDMPKKAVAPHLTARGRFFGNIGERTDLVDVTGANLYVGDIVSVYDYEHKTHLGHTFVVRDTEEGYQIMGAFKADFKKGISEKEGLKIKKFKSYPDLEDGETVHRLPVKVVLK